MKNREAGYFTVGALLGGVVVSLIHRHIRADKILIVTDGSVDVEAINSKIRGKGVDKPKKHKWTSRPDFLLISYGRSTDAACDEPVATLGFDTISKVELQIKDDQLANSLTTVTGRNENDKLYLEMDDDWEFKGSDTARQLHRSGQVSIPAAARLAAVKVYFSDPLIPPLTFPATAEIHLCAKFVD